jgi:3-oxoacyl-[acyl-carrier-protein] synthase II
MSADAYHMTAPNVDGPRRSMVNALRNAGVNADQVNYLNAHGTSTPLGDVNETNAIKAALGDARASGGQLDQVDDRPPAGRRRRHRERVHRAGHAPPEEPPTINIFNQDPECDLDYCANTARDLKIDVALKNNFGFGGTNGTLVFKRV